jgi:hypothetical protein
LVFIQNIPIRIYEDGMGKEKEAFEGIFAKICFIAIIRNDIPVCLCFIIFLTSNLKNLQKYVN